ncbi:MAG: ABC transporter ATP-binding protein [Treponema sp.]|jgi:iron complex transport system ATP-binding protein|nr:ABC transporter ATP-binding protein [Treponema sp.]
MITVSNLCAGYGGVDVIKNISFTVKRGEGLCILGPNGCGKSTLLKAIARIIAYRGIITLEGRNIAAVPRKELAKKIALLGQNMRIYFPYTVYETVALGRYAYSEGFLKNLSPEDKAAIEDAIEKLDIEDIKDRMIDELSGGQLQRVFLAKTLAQNPDIILLDEPTNHLDLKNQVELLRYLTLWMRENNKTFIGVFHDLNLAHHLGNAALLMSNGEIAAMDTVDTVLNSDVLKSVYGIDVRAFMLESLGKWK